MTALCLALQFLSVAALGLFLGAMLTEGGVLVPWWQSLAPADFLAWYAANDRRLLGFFSPVTTGVALTAVAAAVGAVWMGQPGRWLAVTAAGLMLAAVATFFLYFETANAGFAAGTIPVDAVPAELARWAAWHRARTGISLAALAAALAALWRTTA